MSSARLLDRQTDLLRYLTSGAAIFGDGNGAAPAPPHGFDRAWLRLEAKFSFEKRLTKIEGVLAETFACLGGIPDPVLAAFAEACPPFSAARYDNARQFHEFLCRRWQREPPKPPYVRDLAAFEIAYAEVRTFTGAEDGGKAAPHRDAQTDAEGLLVRRRPGAALLRCDFDIRCRFEEGLPSGVPTRRETFLAIGVRPGDERPGVCAVPAAMFALLHGLADWNRLDDGVLADWPGLADLLRGLAARGIVEIAG